jgi:phosphoglycerol geranylgeranyltransferase
MTPEIGRVERYLLDRIRREGAIHLTLLDPEKTTVKEALTIAKEAKHAGTAAMMIGGSTVVETSTVDEIVRTVRKANLPVIIFPNNLSAISRYADAIWFMSLLNSTNPYFITGAQSLASSMIKKYDLEAIPMGYIIVGAGGAAAMVGQATPIPFERPEIIAAYAMAAQYLGMRFVYLEAGSGAKKPVPPSVITFVRNCLHVPLVIGGGIKTPHLASVAVKAGAQVVVTGTLVEKKGGPSRLRRIIKIIKSTAKRGTPT